MVLYMVPPIVLQISDLYEVAPQVVPMATASSTLSDAVAMRAAFGDESRFFMFSSCHL